MKTPVTFPRLWLDIARDRGAQPHPDGSFDGGELDRVGVAIVNGCPNCGATVSAGNSYQIDAENQYTYCRDCAGLPDHDEG